MKLKLKPDQWAVAIFAVFAVILFSIAVFYPADASGRPPLGVTNLDSLHLSDTGGTAVPVLRANQKGTGKIVEFLDDGTPVWSLNDGGSIAYAGNQTVTGSFTVTNNSTFGDAADDTATINGDMILNGIPDTDTDNYDNWFEITGNMTGRTTKDRNYGLLIDMTRPAGQELDSGDHNEAGLKIRVDYEIVTTTVGTTLRAIDAEAKVDNPSGTVTNLYGGSFTAKSDTGAGSVSRQAGLTVNSQNNAAVDDFLAGVDIVLYRQAATVPTEEYVAQFRSLSSTGSGAKAAIYVKSDYAGSATTDSFDYGLDFDDAAINTADIRLENGETISNQTDTAIQIGGFLALEEGAVIDLGSGGTITPNASYQPITNATGGSIDTDATTAIANGAIAGALLVICNEDAQSVVIKDAANTAIGGDKTLTGGAQDCITLIWNGADWVGLSFHDN